MSRFDLVIFDYDGVIADSELLNNRVLAELLTEAGLATTVDEAIATYMGRRWLDCVPLIEERLGQPCPDFLHAEWTRRCHQEAHARLEAVDGVAAFVEGLHLSRCVASSSPPAWIEMGLDRFGLRHAFGDSIYSAAVHVTRGKPHPDLFLHAADAMGAAANRTLVIEDTVTGVTAGVAAGMTVIGLCAGGHIRPGHADRLAAAGAHHVVESYAEVAPLFSS
ncbi:HAD-IA family hydrolase [Brevundimonas sp.]|uniref:HAD family hydrolase n=1 Tax=Brevundimonas sp. TaxID=1871086 RepID=UPI0025E60F53|nr:HAD-IA family hydrolase [Brevundimonas sp.]